jgi:alpha-tubulin suppressor-like RCC1 family protein
MTYISPSVEQPTNSRPQRRPQPRPLLLGLLCLLLPLASLRAQTTVRYTQVSGGETYTVALRADNTLWAWGGNSYSQLGNGNTTGRLLPAQVPAPIAAVPGTTWTGVVAGPSHVVARRSDGTLWGWGYNNNGQLGDGTSTNRVSPVLIAAPAGAAAGSSWGQVATSGRHTLALRSDNSLWAWGSNAAGTIGDNTTNNRLTPTAVTTPPSAAAGTSWTQVAVGDNHSLALRTDGTLWAWGNNSYGQLADNTFTNRLLPTLVAAPTGAAAGTTWTHIAAGLYHSVGLRSDGSLWTWGYNSFGQLGDASTTSSSQPVAVVTPGTVGAGTRWTSIAANDNHTVALRSDGSLWAWGNNSYGQLGDNSIVNRSTPVRETTNAAWSQLTTCRYHTVALSASAGLVQASGFNAQGQLGTGNTTNSLMFVASAAPVLATRPAAAARLAVYPNPAHGQCHLPALPPTATLHLTDSQGRLVRSQPTTPTLSLTGLAAGLYLLRVQEAGQPPRLARLVVE